MNQSQADIDDSYGDHNLKENSETGYSYATDSIYEQLQHIKPDKIVRSIDELQDSNLMPTCPTLTNILTDIYKQSSEATRLRSLGRETNKITIENNPNMIQIDYITHKI